MPKNRTLLLQVSLSMFNWKIGGIKLFNHPLNEPLSPTRVVSEFYLSLNELLVLNGFLSRGA